MDTSLQILCDALKKVLSSLKPQQQPVSFLLLTGKSNQGKTALIRQAKLTLYPLDTDNGINLFYNQQGVILELGEDWLNRSEALLANTLKRLNRCHPYVKISGIILCIDSSELLLTEPVHLIEACQSHTQLLERFGNGLGYRVDIAIFFSKLDTLAGFCEFFQGEHISDLAKPMGFSLENKGQKKKFFETYHRQFDFMLEMLGQKIINKLHPARSSVKRTLIREFPLQLNSLRVPVQAVIQHLNHQLFHLQALYFASAEQGGVSVDRLNRKIQHEYTLTIQDQFPQANNYKPYFIEGAVRAFQEQTKHPSPQMTFTHKAISGAVAGLVLIALSGLAYQHWTTSRILDETSKELLSYETLIDKPDHQTTALYHLSQAENKLDTIPINFLSTAIVQQLKVQLQSNAKSRLHDMFLPDFIAHLEGVITNPSQTQLARYEALKIYLMLGEPQYFSEAAIVDWYKTNWNAEKRGVLSEQTLNLLQKALKQPMQPVNINKQLVSDARNFLNALPPAYLYYSLAKEQFPQDKKAIDAQGFELPNKEVPIYFTKAGFQTVMGLLPKITQQLQQENWVLARQDLSTLQTQLEQAYCFEYVTWWQHFIKRTRPQHYQAFQQAKQLAQTLEKTDAFSHLITLLQEQTSPDLSGNATVFNQQIASQFTSLNLMSQSTTRELSVNISELEKFLTTLELVNDNGQTVFNLTKARFAGDSVSDPLSALYTKAKQLPEPVSTWAKQIADDTWFIFINESKAYLNHQWQEQVYKNYQTFIAHRYPLDPNQTEEIALAEFDKFFAPEGELNHYVNQYLKPFLDVSKPQWQPKDLNGYVMPISHELIDELIRANVISNMFFPENSKTSKIDFTLQKINLDPVVANLQLSIGDTKLTDSQTSDSYATFSWPQSDAKLAIYSIEGNHYELEETGPWAFFKILQKVNVLVDNNDSASLQILFEVNGNSGRYLLKTQNQINPFSPGILTGFNLTQNVIG